TLHAHIYEKSFMDNYTLWTKHSEPGVVMQDSEGDDDDNIADWAHLYEAGAFEDEPMDDAEEMDEAGENAAEDQPPDELGQVLVDSQRDWETLKESKKFEKMLEDYKKLLYPNCKQGLKKLGTTLEMNCPLQHTKQRRLFALLDWRYRKFTHVLTIVFSIEVKNMRNWMLVLSVMKNSTRSGKMILVRSTGSPSRKKFPLR